MILIISSEFPPGPGGIGQHAYSLALALCKSQNVVVLANQDYANETEIGAFNSALPTNLNVIRFAKRAGKITSIKRIVQAIKLVKNSNPRLVYTSGLFPLWVGAILKLIFRKQHIFGFAHGSEVHLNSGLRGKVTHIACAKHDGIFAVSNFTASLLKSQGLNNISVLANGLDEEFIAESSRTKNEPYSWKGSPKLLTVGNVTPRKGQHRVIKALPAILKKFPEAHYHIVGLPTNAEKLTQLAKELGVEGALTFHGKLATRQELYRAFRSADVFLMLSENQENGDVEGFGIAILEANAFGVPAIGATGCGIEDAISKDSGILVDGNDALAVEQAITSILENDQSFRHGARTWAEKHNWAELVKNLP